MTAKKKPDAPEPEVETLTEGDVILPHEDADGTSTRLAYVTAEDFMFSPGSLVGSWFHALENDSIILQGVVLAEPAMGTYLLHVEKLDPGAECVQILVSMDVMADADEGYEYRFYDSEADAKSAYARWVSSEGERA